MNESKGHDSMCIAATVPTAVIGDTCHCDLIAKVRADERERIAAAIEHKADDLPIEDYVMPELVDTWRQAKKDLHDAARIARNGGRDE